MSPFDVFLLSHPLVKVFPTLLLFPPLRWFFRESLRCSSIPLITSTPPISPRVSEVTPSHPSFIYIINCTQPHASPRSFLVRYLVLLELYLRQHSSLKLSALVRPFVSSFSKLRTLIPFSCHLGTSCSSLVFFISLWLSLQYLVVLSCVYQPLSPSLDPHARNLCRFRRIEMPLV